MAEPFQVQFYETAPPFVVSFPLYVQISTGGGGGGSGAGESAGNPADAFYFRNTLVPAEVIKLSVGGLTSNEVKPNWDPV
jgi:hypothetical protein